MELNRYAGAAALGESLCKSGQLNRRGNRWWNWVGRESRKLSFVSSANKLMLSAVEGKGAGGTSLET
jgi:hypothetical protein